MINNCITDGTAVAVLFLGAANSGKDTQGEMLIRQYQGHHISTGALVRNKMDTDKDFRKKHGRQMEQGGLIPDDIIFDLIMEYAQENQPEGIIALNGWSRTKPQADMLDKIFTTPQHSIAFDFDIPLTVAQERARIRKRFDDNEINRRFRLWQQHRVDVIHKLRAKGVRVVELDGRHDPDHINNSVKGEIINHVKALKGLVGVNSPNRHRSAIGQASHR